MSDAVREAITRLTRKARSPWAREFTAFGASTVFDHGARFASNLVCAAILGPSAWGTWFLLSLVLQYGGLIHLGALNGMGREIPAALGRGRPEEADTIRAVALGFTLGSLLLGLVLAGAVMLPTHVIPASRLMLLVVALLFGQQLYTFVMTTFKARMNFFGASRLQLASAVTFPIAVIGGASIGGLEGFLAGQAAWYAGTCMIAAVRTHRLLRPAWSAQVARRLIQIGFPIMLVGLAHAAFATIDRWVIQGSLGSEPLGHYAIAVMAVAAVGLLPQVVGDQVFPRMAEAWARTPHWSVLEPLMARQRQISFVVAVPTVIVVAALAPPLIRSFMPSFEPGIPALLVLLAIPLLRPLGQGFANAFNAVGRQVTYLAAIFGSAVVNAVTSLALVSEYGLVGVAVGTVLGYVTLAGTLLAAGGVARRRAR